MQIQNKKSSKPIIFALVAGIGFGVAFGVIRSAHLSKPFAILSGIAVLLILWLIFRQGKASAYAEAQAWAQSVANSASEAYSIAEAKANALSQAYASAISQANATASNVVNLSLPALDSRNSEQLQEFKYENFAIEHSGLYSDDRGIDESANVDSPSMATRTNSIGVELDSEKS